MAKLLDAGLIYEPRYGRSADPNRCRHAVHDELGVGYHQCSKRAKVQRTVERHGKTASFGYCGIHDPVEVARKSEAREAKYRAEAQARMARYAEQKRLQGLRDAAVAAIREIATGHNDPRALALEVLRNYGEN